MFAYQKKNTHTWSPRKKRHTQKLSTISWISSQRIVFFIDDNMPSRPSTPFIRSSDSASLEWMKLNSSETNIRHIRNELQKEKNIFRRRKSYMCKLSIALVCKFGMANRYYEFQWQGKAINSLCSVERKLCGRPNNQILNTSFLWHYKSLSYVAIIYFNLELVFNIAVKRIESNQIDTIHSLTPITKCSSNGENDNDTTTQTISHSAPNLQMLFSLFI